MWDVVFLSKDIGMRKTIIIVSILLGCNVAQAQQPVAPTCALREWYITPSGIPAMRNSGIPTAVPCPDSKYPSTTIFTGPYGPSQIIIQEQTNAYPGPRIQR